MTWDAELFLTINEFFSKPALTGVFSLITWLGNGWIQAVLVVSLMGIFRRHHLRRHLVAIVLTAAFGGLVVVGLKEIVARPRPPAFFEQTAVWIHLPGSDPRDYSFPSGHTQTAFSTATYVSLLYPTLSPLLMIAAALVGISRIVLGVHFPLDVLVGSLLGILFAIAGFCLNQRISARTKPIVAAMSLITRRPSD